MMDVPQHALVFVERALPLVFHQIVIIRAKVTVTLHVKERVIKLAPEGVVETLSIISR